MTGTTVSSFLPVIEENFKEIPHIGLMSRLVMTMSGLFVALFSSIAGYLADKFGRIKIMVYALVLFALAGTSGFYLNNIYLILTGRAFLGIAAGTIMTTLNALIGDYYEDDERNSFFSLHASVLSFGAVFFMMMGGVLADINWHLPFIIYSFSIIAAIIVSKILYEPKYEISNIGKSLNKVFK